MKEKLLGCVLCGGQSLRMGIDKATLPYRDGTFLEHAIGRLRKVCHDVAVSGQTKAEHNVVTIQDRLAMRGPAVGIAASLSYALDHGYEACLITPVDTPSLTVKNLADLRDRWLVSNELTVAISDRIEPLIGIYPVELADDLRRLTQSDDRSLFRWIQSQPHAALPFPAQRVRNINTPEDLSEHGC